MKTCRVQGLQPSRCCHIWHQRLLVLQSTFSHGITALIKVPLSQRDLVCPATWCNLLVTLVRGCRGQGTFTFKYVCPKKEKQYIAVSTVRMFIERSAMHLQTRWLQRVKLPTRNAKKNILQGYFESLFVV